MKKNDIKFSMRMTEEQMEFLRVISEEQERSVSFIIRKMINREKENKFKKQNVKN